jgi:hypothetical protein
MKNAATPRQAARFPPAPYIKDIREYNAPRRRDTLRARTTQHRHNFLIGALSGLTVVFVKLLVVLPIDAADLLYGMGLLVTLVISVGELLEIDFQFVNADQLDSVLGFLFPLDCYAVLVLFGLPLPD